jgi:hypothetical protein
MSFHHKARRSLLAASLCFASAAPAMADDAHHPPAAIPAPPAATAPATPGMDRGMMNQGMMQQMMGQGAANQPAGMSMMSMMGMSEAGRLERVNGHLAFLQAELKIADAQLPLWSKFADAVRASAQAHNRMMDGNTAATKPEASPVAHLEHQEHALAQRLNGVRAVRGALAPLYAALSPEQQKTFSNLLPMRMMM